MASQTAICNQALNQVGHETVTAVDSTTDQGRTLLAAWSIALDALLSAHAWGFATKRVDLQQLAATPVFGYDHAYQVPSDCIRVLVVEPDTKYALEGSQILSDEDELSLLYVRRVTETGLFSPLFTVALADAIAARICFKLEGSASKRKMLEELAAMSLQRAVFMDAKEAWHDPGPDDSVDSWLTARGSYSSNESTLVLESGT